MTDNSDNTSNFVVDYFRVKVDETVNLSSRNSLAQTVDSFDRFMGGTPVSFQEFTDELIGEWITWLFSRGYSLATVIYYVNRLSSLYGKAVKEGLTGASVGFADIKEKLSRASLPGIEINADPECFRKLSRLVHSDFSGSQHLQLAKDMVLFAIYNGGLTFKKLASYKKTDYAGDDRAILDIVEKYSKPKNKYLFPLNQSGSTPNQLLHTIAKAFSDVLKMVGINLSSYSSSTAVDLWASVAMRCGVSASEIAACIGHDVVVNPLYSFAAKTELPDDMQEDIRRLVVYTLTENPENWYAMQFRRGVRFDMIKSRMEITGLKFRDYYYPMEDIYRRIGKKMVRDSKPVVPGLLFFRCRSTEVPELFYHIGDLAWGYRQSRSVRSPYAVISPSAILKYQYTIGKFTENTEVFPEGTIQIEEGDKVEIIGGDLVGKVATFEKEIHETDKESGEVKRIIYRLRLMGSNNIEWVVHQDPRLVAKIPDNKYAS